MLLSPQEGNGRLNSKPRLIASIVFIDMMTFTISSLRAYKRVPDARVKPLLNSGWALIGEIRLITRNYGI